MTTLEINSRNAQQDCSGTEQLVRRAQGGDVDAFGELVKRYRRRVIAYVIRVTGETDSADEVAQEVFLAAYQSLGRFEAQSEFSKWLIGIAKNKAISALRGQIARERRENAAGLQRLSQWRLEQADKLGNERLSEQIERLDRCLEKLNPEHRRLLDRHYRENDSAETIAKDIGRSGSGVRMLFLRLRNALYECMQRESNE